jgi:7,8-dihydropterin-6-yl-methyl-4-(beta-D-ribofuranosyl)aminobenzene 5'-phosphate synthase
LASAAPIQVPTVDRLSIRVLVDQQHDQFLRGSTVNGVVHEGPGPGRSADARNVLHNEWGLSLYLESQREQEQRTMLLDFGYTSPAIINNMSLLKIDPGKIQALERVEIELNRQGFPNQARHDSSSRPGGGRRGWRMERLFGFG